VKADINLSMSIQVKGTAGPGRGNASVRVFRDSEGEWASGYHVDSVCAVKSFLDETEHLPDPISLGAARIKIIYHTESTEHLRDAVHRW
jgi:hypothetical protein